MRNNEENMDWDLLTKYLANEVNHFEKRRFEALLEKDEDVEREFLDAKKAWEEAGYVLHYKNIDTESAFSKVMSGTEQKGDGNATVVTGKSRRPVYVASIVFLLLVGFLAYLFIPRPGSPQMVSLSTDTNTEAVVLSDGSQVNLNHQSSINYPAMFKGEMRIVSLEGEGFFSVAPDAQKPFVVSVGEMQVEVLGTAFNIRAYPHEEDMEVVVDHGKVEVSVGSSKVFLLKGEKAILNKQTGILLKTVNSDLNYNAWKTRRVRFDETSMDEVIRVLESVYGIQVEVKQPSILDNKLSATFNHSDIQSVMMVVCRTFNLKYEENNRRYLLSEPGD